MKGIFCRGLTKEYPEGHGTRVVLQDVSLEIQAGELVAILGRSGSGKSTLLNLLSGVDLPDSGEIEVDGRSLSSLSENERTQFRLRRIGFVFQFFNLVPTLTAWENVCLPLELADRLDREDVDRARRLLEEVGLGDRGDTFPDKLSGGEQQRVAIARALVHEPAVILADEPTGNLDAETAAQVGDLLENQVRAAGRTLVIATHSHEWIDRADRVIRVVDRKLFETTGRELSSEPQA